jgi:hypothetical protein
VLDGTGQLLASYNWSDSPQNWFSGRHSISIKTTCRIFFLRNILIFFSGPSGRRGRDNSVNCIRLYTWFVMSPLNVCDVTVSDRWGVRKGRGNLGVGMGSIAPTRDKCGWAFAPRASKGGFPSKLNMRIKNTGCTKGENWSNCHSTCNND